MTANPVHHRRMKHVKIDIQFVREKMALRQFRVSRMDLPGPTTSVGTRTDYSVGPWDYPTCAARHLMA
jgi:hypothetical protein